MDWRTYAAVGALGLAAFGGAARADDTSDLRAQLDSLQRKVRALENLAPSQDEISATVAQYMTTSPQVAYVGGGADGSAGFPLGKKPYIKEGPNKLEIAFRNQVRYEAFLYGDDAVGTLSDTGNPVSDEAPRDRSGFEIERLYIGFDGSIFCEDITFKLELNFDADSGTGVEKRYAYMDWKYAGEHHIRAGADKVAYCAEENHSSSVLSFVDRSIVGKAFEVGFDTGVAAWGYFGTCDCPKNFMYKVQVMNGEGLINRGSVFNTDAFDTYSDNLLLAAAFEWNVTCNDWKMDMVDHRPCDKRCNLDLSIGLAGIYENDDDSKHDQWGGLRLGDGNDRAERYGLDFWVRGQWNGLSWLGEFMLRNIQYTRDNGGGPSTKPEQEDMGASLTVHYRFADSNWGIGARAGIIWLDDDYLSVTSGPQGNTTTVALEDTITEFGVAVNYFFYDHNSKITADVNFVQDNSGVNSSSAGYMNGASRGVLVEDGVFLRIQWQLNF